MAEAGWLRFAALAAVAIHPGCSCSDNNPPAGSTSTGATTTTSSGAGGMGGAGGGGMGGTGGAPVGITPVAEALALDATPGAQGSVVFFSGIHGGQTGLFRRAADGSGDTAPVAVGSPFVAPFGIATSTDGATIYVADLGAVDTTTGTDTGRLFSVNAATGGLLPVSTGSIQRVRSLELYADAQGADRMVLSGIDGADGLPGVFDLPAIGGTPTALAKGLPLADPSGIAVSTAGDTVYVCDTLPYADKTATIFTIARGVVNELMTGLHVGYPCGIALSRDDATLFALVRGDATGADEVLSIDVASRTITATVSAGLGAFTEPAGMHRAKLADIFAFADSKAQGTGGVFLMK